MSCFRTSNLLDGAAAAACRPQGERKKRVGEMIYSEVLYWYTGCMAQGTSSTVDTDPPLYF